MSRGAKLPAPPVSPPHCCRPTLLSSIFRWNCHIVIPGQVWRLYHSLLPRKLRGREETRCPNCSLSLAKRPKMSVPELPPVEAPEEEVEEEVKITAEEMANMAVSNRPHTQVNYLRLTSLYSIKFLPNQVDYIHHLVPDLCQITACSFYWGKMDRYQAFPSQFFQIHMFLLQGMRQKPFWRGGLRAASYSETVHKMNIYSVSAFAGFCSHQIHMLQIGFWLFSPYRYGRSLHARIEEQNHKFSFDCHDPGVFMSANIPSLMEHYKDPASCMFFEPMLCQAVNRKDPFSLQFLARATICDTLNSYSSVDKLELPKSLKAYLKEYHYRHKVRVRRLDLECTS